MQPGQHRETARVILHDSQSRVFLLLTHFDPEVGLPPRWITPGGGIDTDENPIQAAVRELREETGLIIRPEALGEQIWQTGGTWIWADGNQHTYRDYFFKLQVDNFELDDSGWTDDERRDVIKHRWWTMDELIDSEEFFGPHGLVDFLTREFKV